MGCNFNKPVFQKIGVINGGQDGAIWNGYIFRIDTKGCCTVTRLDNLSKVYEFVLDKCEEIVPHSNSVCFGNEYYSENDDFPLLYANIYNNYQSCSDRKEGMCCVYRIIREKDTFSSKLIRIIKIDFTQDVLWRSENVYDVRPYGNFLVDTKNSLLYAFLMRDEEYKTRVFSFKLPSVSENKDTVNLVELKKEEIADMFDCQYLDYMQGAAMYDGYIFSVNGFDEESPHKPTLSIIDVKNKETCTTINLGDYGLIHEPEFIDVYDGQVWYSDCHGNLYKISFN